jgi:hypothetical protein
MENTEIILNESQAVELDLADASDVEYVVDGAKLICDGCPNETTVLQVTSQNFYEMKNKLVATKKDKEPIRNIIPFKSCIYNGACELLILGDWENYIEDKFCGENQCLSKDSFARCDKGGIIRIIHSGQYLSSEQIAKDSKELMKIASQGGLKEEIKKELSEYLSKKYNQTIKVEDFKFTNGKFPTLDIITRGESQNTLYRSNPNKNIQHDIDEYNRNGIFFQERKRTTELEQMTTRIETRGTKDIDFPIMGNEYKNSEDYYKSRNISQAELNKKIDEWFKKASEKWAYRTQITNDIKRVKNISVFDKRFDNFWLTELDVEVIGSKRDKLGNIILTVNDYGNNLNKRSNQGLLKEYNKNGIILKNGFVGTQASSITSLYEYEKQSYVSDFSYGAKYIDENTTARFYGYLSVIREELIKSAYNRANVSTVNRDNIMYFIEKQKDTVEIKFKDLTDKEILEKMNEARDELADKYKKKYGAYGSGVKFDDGVKSDDLLKSGVIMACHSGSKEKPKMCVEDNLVENLGENIKIGDVIGVRRNKETRKFYQKPLPVCPKCQGNYSKDKFIEGILYEAGGPWDEKYK